MSDEIEVVSRESSGTVGTSTPIFIMDTGNVERRTRNVSAAVLFKYTLILVVGVYKCMYNAWVKQTDDHRSVTVL